MSTSKYSEALKAIDIQNKIVGAYAPEKQEVITNEHIVVF